MGDRICSIEDCDHIGKVVRGLCKMHYHRWQRSGNPLETLSGRTVGAFPAWCIVDGCLTDSLAKGYCSKHYQRWQRTGDPLNSGAERPTCSVSGCEMPHYGNGMCRTHNKRVRVNGNTFRYRDLPRDEWFWARLTLSADGCWIWGGAIDEDGYGVYTPERGQGQWRAHRWSYEFLIGEIPAGLELDHLCFTKPCVNPYHLDPVTSLVNNQRRDAHLRAVA